MEKSKLFTLVVTPSLLERHDGKPNYIMKKEYPEAKKSGTPILPVEMRETERAGLEQEFDGIPPCLPPTPERIGQEELIDRLRRVALEENDADPVHNYLIGLAYLDGIDVEPNHARAVRLITGAAESGLVEAVEQLISMYFEGKGVERSYETSAQWRERLVDLRRKRYEQSGSEGDLHDYVCELFYLGDAHRAMGQLDPAGQAYRTAMEAILEREGYADSQTLCRDLSASYNRLGDIAQAQGRLKEAEEYYQQSLELRQALARETKTVESRRDLSVSYNKLGDIAKAQGRPEEAREYYQQDLDLAQALARETGTPEAWDDLAVSYYKVGLVDGVDRNMLEQARDIWSRLAEECPDKPRYARNRDIVAQKLMENRPALHKNTKKGKLARFLAKLFRRRQ